MINRDENQPPGKWHFDRTVNITVAVGFIVSIFSGVWFASGVSHDVEDLKAKAISMGTLSDRTIRLETKMDEIHTSLDEVKHLLRLPPDQRH